MSTSTSRLSTAAHALKDAITVHSVRVSRNYLGGDDASQAWKVAVQPKSEECNWVGVTVQTQWPTVNFVGSSDFAKSAERLKTGDVLPMTGEIEFITVRPTSSKMTLRIEFIGQPEITSPHLKQ